MAKIVLGVTASIAAYKSYEIARELQKLNHSVSVILTKTATNFVSKHSYIAPCHESDLFTEPYAHINLGKSDLILIAPAGANFIANLANGICNDLLLSVCLATQAPILVFPAMNSNMLTNPATQANIDTLKQRNIKVQPTQEGVHACGTYGPGRLIPVSDIIATVTSNL